MHVGVTSWCQVAQVWSFGTHFIEQFHVQRNPCFVCNSQQVEYAVGGAAQRHVACQSIADGLFVDDVTGLDILFYQVHDGHASMLCQLDSAAVYSRNGTVARQADTDGFTQTVHAVGSVHAGAGTAARADIQFVVFQARIVDNACLVSTDGFKHFGKRSFHASNQTAHHWAAGNNYSRNVHADSCHNHSRYDLVAVWYQNQTVKLMSHGHGFHTVCNQFTGGQGVLHTHVPHGDTITDTDSRNHNRCTAGHPYTRLYSFRHLIQVHMARHDFTVSRNHADQRTFQFFLGISHGIEQASHWSTFRAFCYIVTSSGHFSKSFRHTIRKPGSIKLPGIREIIMLSKSYFFSQLIMALSSAPTLHSRWEASIFLVARNLALPPALNS